MPRVVSDGAAQLLGRTVGLFEDISCQPLCALANGSFIDRVGTKLIHAAAPSPRAERDDRPEHIIQLLPSSPLDMLENGRLVGLVPFFRQPALEVL